MKICIDTDLLKNKYKISLEEILLLMLVRTCDDLDGLYSLVERQGMIMHSVFDNKLIVTKKYSELLDTILLKSDAHIPEASRISSLASTLRDMFPKGFKSGSVSWRGTQKEIEDKLMKFFKIYGDNYTDEQIINATKKYLEIHQADGLARCLKYFILKAVDDISEDGKMCRKSVSDLAEMLATEDDGDAVDVNWMVNVN